MANEKTTMSSKLTPGRWPLWLGGFVLLIFGMLAGCSSIPEANRSDLRDPFEHTNRKIFAFNMGVDSYVLEPVADGYRSNVPDTGRRAVDNHLDWAGLPSTALNSTIQGDLENVALATIHFAINGLTFGFVDLTEDPGAVETRFRANLGTRQRARGKLSDGAIARCAQ